MGGCSCKSKNAQGEDKEERFYIFPKQKEVRDKWISFVAGGDRDWEPHKYSVVCSCHFREEMKFPGHKRGRLSDSAYPKVLVPLNK